MGQGRDEDEPDKDKTEKNKNIMNNGDAEKTRTRWTNEKKGTSERQESMYGTDSYIKTSFPLQINKTFDNIVFLNLAQRWPDGG